MGFSKGLIIVKNRLTFGSIPCRVRLRKIGITAQSQSGIVQAMIIASI